MTSRRTSAPSTPRTWRRPSSCWAIAPKTSRPRVDKRDPYKLFHKVDLKGLRATAPEFDWDSYLKIAGLARLDTFNVTEPEFYKELAKTIPSNSLHDITTSL